MSSVRFHKCKASSKGPLLYEPGTAGLLGCMCVWVCARACVWCGCVCVGVHARVCVVWVCVCGCGCARAHVCGVGVCVCARTRVRVCFFFAGLWTDCPFKHHEHYKVGSYHRIDSEDSGPVVSYAEQHCYLVTDPWRFLCHSLWKLVLLLTELATLQWYKVTTDWAVQALGVESDFRDWAVQAPGVESDCSSGIKWHYWLSCRPSSSGRKWHCWLSCSSSNGIKWH